MHEECYNRNLRAASVKNIPIPGVQLVEENDENITEGLFFRFSSEYFQQVESDIEMALNPSSILYDMDSDDEQWIMNCKSSAEIGCSGLGEISDDIFEKTMDMFEKPAYTRGGDQFTPDEIDDDHLRVLAKEKTEERLPFNPTYSGRRLNGFGLADERIAYCGYYNHELLDDSPLLPTSLSLFSFQDPGNVGYMSMGYDGLERDVPSEFHRSKSKKHGSTAPSAMQLYNQRTISNRSKVEWRRHQYQDDLLRQYIQQLDPCAADVLRLRDASGAAKLAVHKAKLKRERAREMQFRAAVAIHMAVVGLITVEAIKTSSEDTVDGDG